MILDDAGRPCAPFFHEREVLPPDIPHREIVVLAVVDARRIEIGVVAVSQRKLFHAPVADAAASALILKVKRIRQKRPVKSRLIPSAADAGVHRRCIWVVKVVIELDRDADHAFHCFFVSQLFWGTKAVINFRRRKVQLLTSRNFCATIRRHLHPSQVGSINVKPTVLIMPTKTHGLVVGK